MKKILFALAAVMVMFSSCNKSEDEIIETKQKNFAFNFDFSKDSSDTRAVKSEFVEGDVVYVYNTSYFDDNAIAWAFKLVDGKWKDVTDYETIENETLYTKEALFSGIGEGKFFAVWTDQPKVVNSGLGGKLWGSDFDDILTETLTSEHETYTIDDSDPNNCIINAKFTLKQLPDFVKVTITGENLDGWNLGLYYGGGMPMSQGTNPRVRYDFPTGKFVVEFGYEKIYHFGGTVKPTTCTEGIYFFMHFDDADSSEYDYVKDQILVLSKEIDGEEVTFRKTFNNKLLKDYKGEAVKFAGPVVSPLPFLYEISNGWWRYSNH